MVGKEILIFLTILVAMATLAIVEAYQEGSDGYSDNPDWWKIDIGKYSYTAYHVWMHWIMLPLITIILPLAVAEFSWRLFGLLLISYLIGTVFEDFLWYVANPRVTLKKWNPREAYWYPWLKIGPFAIPWSYLIKFIISYVVWYLTL